MLIIESMEEGTTQKYVFFDENNTEKEAEKRGKRAELHDLSTALWIFNSAKKKSNF